MLTMEFLKGRAYAVTQEEIIHDELPGLIAQGLQVVALCNYGEKPFNGRSSGTVAFLNLFDIPAVYLDRGLAGLSKADRIDQTLVAGKLREVPHVIGVLTDQEKKDCQSLLERIAKVELHSDVQSVLQSFGMI